MLINNYERYIFDNSDIVFTLREMRLVTVLKLFKFPLMSPA